MKKGKRELPRSKKGLTALVALVLIFCCAVGGTAAWLATATDPVTNTFTPSHVTTEVHEGVFIGEAKKNVTVKNTSDIAAYIRAAIIINWANEDGNVYGKAVTADDYDISINETDWKKGNDGFYYYNSIVAANGGMTPNLILSCTEKDGKAPDGYHLQVTILADGIQADGMGATSAQDAFAKAKTN